MVEALNRISPHITEDIKRAELNIAKTTALYAATKATSSDALQPEVSKIVANSLLGENAIDLASFSFSGDNANTIVLNEYYDNVNLMVKYSLDGGDNWIESENHKIELTQDEINSITAEKDIIVGLVGINATHTIDILSGKNISTSTMYNNDLENLLIGDTEYLEYSLDGGNTWNDYDLGLDSEVRFTGDIVVNVRYKAQGTYLAGAVDRFTFKDDGIIDPKSTYLQLRHVTLYDFSSEQGSSNAAAQFIDGNYNTRWHTTWDWVDNDKYISVEFDKVRYISKLTYVPHDTSGRLRSGNVYTSMDGVNWEKVHSFSDLPNNTSVKTIDLGDSYEAKYVKIESTESYGKYENQTNGYFAGRMLNFYEDTTKVYNPMATIEYSNEAPTNGDVIAKLVLPSGCTAEETEFTFSSNTTHDFIYIDANGDEHTVTAEVNWIDTILPTMEYEFDNTNPTNEDITLTITGFNKDNVKIVGVSENADLVEESIDDGFNVYPNTYTFTENKTIIFKLMDSAGNISQVPVTVDWIDRVAPNAILKYSTTSLTNENVTVTLEGFTEEGVVVTNNNGSLSYTFEENGSFTFEIEDQAGNKNSITAIVSWIDKDAPNVTISYSTTDLTNQDVVVTLEGLEDGDTIVSEGGSTHTFKENGSFEFVVRDEVGNETRVPVNVNWIDKEAPTVNIVYDIDSWTNHSVIATITDSSEAITILNPSDGSDSYVFNDNGEFTFEFVDKAGNVGTATAKVNWIDKEAPTATVKYSTTKPTNGEVTVTLENISEEVTIRTESGKPSYTFTANGTYDFVLVDRAGNETVITAEVDWIKTEGPNVSVEYDVTDLTNSSVTATLVGLEDGDKVIGNCGDTYYTFTNNGSYTFVVEDEAGNRVEVEAKVDWIDKEAPTAELVYSTTDLTNGDVTVSLENFSEEGVVVKNNKGKTTYTFTENGEFTFILVDQAGNETELVAKVENIDKIPPFVMLNYSTTTLTNGDVTVTVEGLQEGDEIVGYNSNSYTFTENGTFEFVVRDKAGNEIKLLAVVDWIDKVAPTATISYSNGNKTNQNVIATLNIQEENIIIENNNGEATYEFTENGEFTFEYVDDYGNTGSTTAKVDWIIKIPDVEATDIKVTYSESQLTNQDVIATIELPEGYTLIGEATHTFTENGTHTFTYQSVYGTQYTHTITVNWIDKVAPTATIEYSTTNKTNQNVTATLNITEENITVVGGSTTHVFENNGEHTFVIRDEAGNETEIKAGVTWINKEKPVLDVTYSTEEETDQPVTATLMTEGIQVTRITGKVITITNNNGNKEYIFTDNGEFTFEYVDDYGNAGSTTAKVDWIVKTPDTPNYIIPEPIKPLIDLSIVSITEGKGTQDEPLSLHVLDSAELAKLKSMFESFNGYTLTIERKEQEVRLDIITYLITLSNEKEKYYFTLTVADAKSEIFNYLDSLIEDKITDVPGNGAGTDAPDNGAGTDAPDNGAGTDVPGNGVENGTLDSDTGNEMSNNNVPQNQETKPQTGVNMSLPFMLGGIMTTLSGMVGIYKNRRK